MFKLDNESLAQALGWKKLIHLPECRGFFLMVMYFINYVPKITFYYAKTKIFVRINKLK